MNIGDLYYKKLGYFDLNWKTGELENLDNCMMNKFTVYPGD